MYPQVSLFHFTITGLLILSLTDVPSTDTRNFKYGVFLFGIQYSCLTSLYEYIYLYFITVWKKYYLMINISSFRVNFQPSKPQILWLTEENFNILTCVRLGTPGVEFMNSLFPTQVNYQHCAGPCVSSIWTNCPRMW